MADDSAGIEQLKNALRETQRQQRARLFRTHGPETYTRAAQHFMKAIAIPRGGVIAGYWPLQDEFDCRPLLEALAAQGALLALPVVAKDSGSLLFREWRPGAPLQPAGYGTIGPGEGAAEHLPSLVIVPFLAFDRRGYRLGYGGGFYDRSLTSLRSSGKCRQAIGLGFSAQRVQQVPAAPYDARLDGVVTEEGAIWARTALGGHPGH